MELKEKFLPVGSVVLLKGGTKKIMITGFCSMANDDKTMIYDYSGCIYPEGYLSSNQICLFNHDQIKELFFLGYEDNEEVEFKKTLNSMLKEIEKEKLSNDFLRDENEDLEYL